MLVVNEHLDMGLRTDFATFAQNAHYGPSRDTIKKKQLGCNANTGSCIIVTIFKSIMSGFRLPSENVFCGNQVEVVEKTLCCARLVSVIFLPGYLQQQCIGRKRKTVGFGCSYGKLFET